MEQFLDTQGFVLRASTSSSRYQIIGPVYQTRVFPGRGIPARRWKWFIFWWDAEDLLVHDWRISQYDDKKGMDEQADLCFGSRFSLAEETSYAIGPFSTDEIRAKLKNDPDTSLLEPE